MGKHDPMLQLASLLLPESQKRGIEALYNWCRRADEVCDAPTPVRTLAERVQLLDELGADFQRLRAGGLPSNPIDAELLWTLEQWPTLDDRPFLDMLAGMRNELRNPRFASFEPELRHYAYCVAGTVGLMLLPVLGVPNPCAKVRACAIDLGVAIQLTNILRDVGYDVELGRIFLPQEDLDRFGVTVADVEARRMTPAYQELVRFEMGRATALLDSARAAVPALPLQSQLAVLAIARLMGGLLEELALRRDCDNLSGKVRLGTLRKAGCVAAAVWDWVCLRVASASLTA